MSPIRQFEPTYRGLRRRLMTGAWPPGMQLVTPRIAEELGVSQSPVRECLSHLAGEAMVDFQPSQGFFVPNYDAAELCDLLTCHHLLLRGIAADGLSAELPPLPSGEDHATRSGVLFEEIARQSGNQALVQIVRSLGDRLHVYRRFDQRTFVGTEDEIRDIAAAFGPGVLAQTRRDLLTRYHVSRKLEAERYVRLRAEGTWP